jgi:MarR family transcriptional regulator, lower aerobic nicotinate degradation pathway regulator
MPRQSAGQTIRPATPLSETRSAAPAWHDIPTAAARRFHQICVAKSSEVSGAFGLTPLQYGAMVHLNKMTGTPGIEQNVLAARLNIDRNTASVIVEHMVKLGVVARQVNSADRRARLLSLTAKGDRIYAELLPAFRTANADVLAPVSPRERKLFMTLLVRIVEGNLREQNR